MACVSKIGSLDPDPGPSGGAGAIVKNMIPAFPFFPFGKKRNKNIIPVGGQ